MQALYFHVVTYRDYKSRKIKWNGRHGIVKGRNKTCYLITMIPLVARHGTVAQE